MNTADKNKAWAIYAHHLFVLETLTAMAHLTDRTAQVQGDRP